MRLLPHLVEPGADGEVLKTVGGESAWAPAAYEPLTVLVPLTTSVGGVPELVWDADNQLVMTEAPL